MANNELQKRPPEKKKESFGQPSMKWYDFLKDLGLYLYAVVVALMACTTISGLTNAQAVAWLKEHGFEFLWTIDLVSCVTLFALAAYAVLIRFALAKKKAKDQDQAPIPAAPAKEETVAVPEPKPIPVPVRREASTGPEVRVRLQVLEDNFEAGETVTLGALKEKGLVPASAGRLTILASGLLDKPLTIVANKFTTQAVHNITLAGGKAIEIK